MAAQKQAKTTEVTDADVVTDPGAVVDPDKQLERMMGGADQPTSDPAGQQPPTTKKIKIGAAEFEVDPGLADAWTAQQQNFETQINEIRGMIPRQPQQPAQPTQTQQPPQPAWGDMIFEDPNKFVAELTKNIREGITKEVGQTYQRDQHLRDFWNDFYRENDDLRSFDWVVKADFERNFNQLADLPTAQARSKLAETVRADILGVAQQFAPQPQPDNRTQVAAGAGPRPKAQPQQQQAAPEEGKIVTLSQTLKQRRADKRKAKAAS